MAEAGYGYNFGPAQVNVAIGKTWADQDIVHGGDIDADGHFLVTEAILPVNESRGLFATLGAYGHWGDADIRRGYLNAGLPDQSKGSPDSRTWGLRARVDWEGRDRQGRLAPSGAYFVRVTATDRDGRVTLEQTVRVALLR